MRYHPDKHRLPPFTVNGVLLADKPAGWTSFDVVNFLRSRFNIPKIGHCGTLDPAATGLLVLVLGKFTQLSQRFSGEDKIYETTLLLGTETATEDLDGEVTRTADYSHLDDAAVWEAIMSFTGPQQQMPPMVSAVKVGGKKLYELARKGIEVEREARDIVIHEIRPGRSAMPYFDFTVHCSKGTYIRTLCADIGRKLGVGGTLAKLRRTRSGQFGIEDALTLEKLKEFEQADLALYLREFMFSKLSRMAGSFNE